MLKGVVKTDGGISLGAYLNGLPVNEIIIRTDGGFSFMKQGKELVRITEDGISYGTSLGDSAVSGQSVSKVPISITLRIRQMRAVSVSIITVRREAEQDTATLPYMTGNPEAARSWK